MVDWLGEVWSEIVCHRCTRLIGKKSLIWTKKACGGLSGKMSAVEMQQIHNPTWWRVLVTRETGQPKLNWLNKKARKIWNRLTKASTSQQPHLPLCFQWASAWCLVWCQLLQGSLFRPSIAPSTSAFAWLAGTLFVSALNSAQKLNEVNRFKVTDISMKEGNLMNRQWSERPGQQMFHGWQPGSGFGGFKASSDNAIKK